MVTLPPLSVGSATLSGERDVQDGEAVRGGGTWLFHAAAYLAVEGGFKSRSFGSDER